MAILDIVKFVLIWWEIEDRCGCNCGCVVEASKNIYIFIAIVVADGNLKPWLVSRF